MTADPTAAERARRYRARRAAVVTSRDDELLELLGDIRAMLVELVNIGGQPVHNRDASVTPAADRDVTNRHGAEGARVNPDDAGPTGPSVVVGETVTAVTLAGEELEPSTIVDLAELEIEAQWNLAILEPPPVYRPSPFVAQLERLLGEPRTLEQLAEILESAPAIVFQGVGELERHGRARRRFNRWMAPGVWVESAGESIRCGVYREHQLEHRRDPASGRFRCYICEPEGLDTLRAVRAAQSEVLRQ